MASSRSGTIAACSPRISPASTRSSTAWAWRAARRAAASVTQGSWARSGNNGPVQAARASSSVGAAPRAAVHGAGTDLAVAAGGEVLEAEGVDRRPGDLDHVAGRPGDEDRRLLAGSTLRLEGPPEVRHVGLQRARRPLGGLVAPHQLDQAVSGDRAADLEEEGGEHGALLATAEVHLGVAVSHHQSAEEVELHGRHRARATEGSVPAVRSASRGIRVGGAAVDR